MLGAVSAANRVASSDGRTIGHTTLYQGATELMIRMLRSLGITSDMVYFGSLGSIVLSLALWFLPRSAASSDRRGLLAIFVGLWPPTLMLLGHALEQNELESPLLADD